mgnify:CR=1 FL=1
MINKVVSFFKAGPGISLISDKKEISQKFLKYRREVLASIIIMYGFGYTCRLALSVVKKPLIDNGIFTIIELGSVGSAYFYGYAFGKFFNGLLADHANIKRFFTFGLIVSGLINISMGLNQSLIFWVIFWGLNGWVQGIGAPSCAIALTDWFSQKERGRYYGIWSTAHAIGEGLTFVGTATIVNYFSWESAFIVPGLGLIIISIIGYKYLHDSPRTLGLPDVNVFENESSTNSSISNKFKDIIRSQFRILKYPSIWILGLAGSSMYVTRYAINSWGVLYLQEARGYSLIEAGSLIGINTFTGILGCVAYGFISDKYFNARRPPVTLMFGIVEIASLFLIFFGPESTIVLTIAFIVYGFTLSGLLAVLGGLFAVDIAPKNATGTAMGFIGLFSYIGAAFQEKLSSQLIDNSITQVGAETIYNFDSAIYLWIGGSIASFLLALSLWNKRAED